MFGCFLGCDRHRVWNMPKPSTLWQGGREGLWEPMYLRPSLLAGCQMVTLLLDNKADPRCLNNLGVMLTCLLFCVLSSLKFGTWSKWSLSWKRRFLLEYYFWGIYRLFLGGVGGFKDRLFFVAPTWGNDPI